MIEISPFGFTAVTEDNFNDYALELFKYQATHVPIYKDFVHSLHKRPKEINQLAEIPFLPVRFFKSHNTYNPKFTPIKQFKSSGTTSSNRSKHAVIDLEPYAKSVKLQFEAQFGPVQELSILALLPNYLEQGDSSLVEMVKLLQDFSQHNNHGFYLDEFSALDQKLKENEAEGIQTILIGVSYALLDFCQLYPQSLQNSIVMETGGMKGRKKEMIRVELHEELKKGFGVERIFSEYGMTEMFSQAYTKGKEKFYSPSWMQVKVRDPYDPFDIQETGNGALNIIDLANYYSVAFLEMEDLGKVYADGSFEILGRLDNSQIRGCNLMVQS